MVPTMKIDTVLTHCGRDPKKYGGMVNPPVYRASTVIFDSVASYERSRGDKFGSIRYGRYGTFTAFELQDLMAQLEGGYRSVVVPSGLAAIAASLSAFTSPGDHVLVSDSIYAPTREFCDTVLRKNGVEVTYYRPDIGAGISELFRRNSRIVFCESPSSGTMEMQDIPSIAKAAHDLGVLVMADNTWATPYFFKPFEKGLDISIQAATKYIVGHSDVMLGVITTGEEHWTQLRNAVASYGYCVSADDCYLALRGLRTLGVRLRQHFASALDIGQWLSRHPNVHRVLYPALETDPGHALWKRDMSGACGLLSIELKPCPKASVDRFIDSLQLFGLGASWGGYESLVLPIHPETSRTVTQLKCEGPLVRLHIGLEDIGDLQSDLAQALGTIESK